MVAEIQQDMICSLIVAVLVRFKGTFLLQPSLISYQMTYDRPTNFRKFVFLDIISGRYRNWIGETTEPKTNYKS